jgi:hypothetical protein
LAPLSFVFEQTEQLYDNRARRLSVTNVFWREADEVDPRRKKDPALRRVLVDSTTVRTKAPGFFGATY